LNLQLRTRASGNESTTSGDLSVATDRDDRDIGPTLDLTINRHAPVRQVISVNGEEEDVENVNIHDFMTFEQEQLIGPEFMGRLKRKSVASEEHSDRGLQRGLSSFRSAVRAVLTTEAIMQAMKHYNHRSDSETEEDDDDNRTPLPTETESRFDSGNNLPETPLTDSCASGNPAVPVSSTSVPSVPNSDLPDICQDKPSESDATVNFVDSPKPDVLVSPTSRGFITTDAGVDDSSVQLADTEVASSTRTAADAKVVDAALSAPASVVVNDAPVGEMHVDDGLDTAEPPASEAANTSETVPVDTSDSKVLLKDVDLSLPQEVAVTTAAVDSDEVETAKPTDGLLTATAERRRTETTDTGCRCCCVQ